MKIKLPKAVTPYVLAAVVVGLVLTGVLATAYSKASSKQKEDLTINQEEIIKDDPLPLGDLPDNEETDLPPTEPTEQQKEQKDKPEKVTADPPKKEEIAPPVVQQPIQRSVSSGDYIVGYYASWATSAGVPPTSLDGNKLTHINYAFADINSDMELYSPNPSTDLKSFEGLRTLKSNYPHLKTLISVGGWDYSKRISDVAATEANRKNFAESCVAFILEHGFDGVDIDWEFPVSGGLPGNSNRPEDKKNYTKLLQEIRASLDKQSQKDGKQYLLTIAGGTGSYFLNKVEISKIASIVDYIFIMGYDLHGPWDTYADFNSPLYAPSGKSPQYKVSVEESVNGYLNAGVPGNKLVMGMPFYGYRYETSDGLYGNFDSAKSISNNIILSDYINDSSFKKSWDDEACIPYMVSRDYFITYENQDSISAKVSFAMKKGLAGVGAWELSQDKNNMLLNAAYNTMH